MAAAGVSRPLDEEWLEGEGWLADKRRLEVRPLEERPLEVERLLDKERPLQDRWALENKLPRPLEQEQLPEMEQQPGMERPLEKKRWLE